MRTSFKSANFTLSGGLKLRKFKISWDKEENGGERKNFWIHRWKPVCNLPIIPSKQGKPLKLCLIGERKFYQRSLYKRENNAI
jgi:hypothetical protein